jgi:AP-3 complex subunit beta
VVIKKLLQLNPEAHKEIIVLMSKLAFKVTVPMARASILWIIGEYSSHVPKFAPDVLRQMAKTFIQEEDIVKLQIINLAAKLYLTNSKHTKLLTTYVLNLAKYDQNYDIRDRARMIRALLFTKETKLHKRAKDFFLSEKPAPNLKSTLEDRSRFQMGTLSHVLNQEANGFIPLPGLLCVGEKERS